jgi:hypothetical protein
MDQIVDHLSDGGTGHEAAEFPDQNGHAICGCLE